MRYIIVVTFTRSASCQADTMNAQESREDRNKLPFLLSFVLLVAHLGFFYLYAIDLKGVLLSITYLTIAIAAPGFVLCSVFFKLFAKNKDQVPDIHLISSLSAVLGSTNILFCYLVSMLTTVHLANYLFIWPFLALLVKAGRSAVGSMNVWAAIRNPANRWSWPILLLFALLFNLYFFAMRPTPGFVPVEIFHDHLWNAGNTVALMSDFPLKSMRIESMPYLSYHILVHIIGAHMALLTGLTPHLVGLQYVFIPLIPILVYSMMSLLAQFFKNDNKYLLYGLAVLLFGGGFHIVHEVKVLNLLGSTNFLGVILLFMFLTISLHLQSFNNFGRFLLMFVGLFMATVAKGTIGIALCGGVGLWWLFQMFKRNFSGGIFVDALGAGTGFLSSYYLFFIWPVLGQQFKNTVIQDGSFPIIPLGYVINNELTWGIVNLIKNYLSGVPQTVTLIFLTLLILPVYILLYYSYRLLVFSSFKRVEFGEAKQKILAVALSSLLIGYSINVPYAQNYAYFITVAVFGLDILFVLFLQQEQAFEKLKKFFGAKAVYPFVGLIVILALPFLDITNRIRDEHTHNYFFTGKIGQRLNDKIEDTNYRKTQQNITPEMYAALDYIRRQTPTDSIIVSSLVNTPDGRPRAFYVSTFSERTAFIEGYFQIEGLAKYADPEEVKEKLSIMEEIFTSYEIPPDMRSKKYIFLCKIGELEKFEENYQLKILYKNGTWAVIHIV